VFRSWGLGTFSALQKGGVLCQYFVPELLKILYPFSFFFLFYKPLLFSFLPCLGLGHLPYLLSSILNMVGLCCLFQVGLKLLLLFMPPLYLSIVLGNVRGNGERYNNTEER